MSSEPSIKKILMYHIKEISERIKLKSEFFPIQLLDLRCKRKIQLDRDPENYNLKRNEISIADVRINALEEKRIGEDRIDQMLTSHIIDKLPEMFGKNLKVEKNIDLEVGYDNVHLSGRADLIITDQRTMKKSIIMIHSIPDIRSKFNIPKPRHLDQLLVLQDAMNKVEGYLVYITRDIGEMIMYIQQYDRTRLSKIKKELIALEQSRRKKELVKKMKDSSQEPCSYECKWADFCWGEDAIPPLRYIF